MTGQKNATHIQPLIAVAGVYPDIPDPAYHADDLAADPSLSCSVAQLLLTRSPAHAAVAHPRLARVKQKRDEAKFVMGTAVHEMLLCGDERIQMIEADDYRKKEAKEARDFAFAYGKIPLLAKQYAEVAEVAEVVREQIDEHPALRGIMDPANVREASVLWREPDFGNVWCRCKPDLVAPGRIIDFKFTGTAATPDSWAKRNAFSLMYDFRAAWYVRGWEAATGEQTLYQFVVIEDEPPYALAVFEPSRRCMEVAGSGIDKALRIWSQCLRSGVWPGYDQSIHTIDMPDWVEFSRAELNARADFSTQAAIDCAVAQQGVLS